MTTRGSNIRSLSQVFADLFRERFVLVVNKPEDCSFSKRSVEAVGEFSNGKVVPEEGLEPTLPRGKRILNPPRLPIPPLRQPGKTITYELSDCYLCHWLCHFNRKKRLVT